MESDNPLQRETSAYSPSIFKIFDPRNMVEYTEPGIILASETLTPYGPPLRLHAEALVISDDLFQI